jgi:type III secretion protein U
MSEQNTGEKTEKPTQKRLEDARQKGQVAQSKDLTMFASFITVLCYFSINFHNIMNDIFKVYDLTFSEIADKNVFALSFLAPKQLIFNVLIVGYKIFAIPIILAAVVSAFVCVSQLGGFAILKESLKIDIERLNPVANAKNIFSMKNLKKLAKDIVEIIVMVVVAYLISANDIRDLINSTYYGFAGISLIFAKIVGKTVFSLLMVYLVFAIIDFINQKREHIKQLMMSREDIKNEMKNTEGDPHIKGRRRELHREIIEEEGIANTVKNATLILTNPTHITIVIYFDTNKVKLPVVLIKAKGTLAAFIRRTATKYEIPMIKDVWLARSLYSLAVVGKYVPSTLVGPIADVIGKNMHLIQPHLNRISKEKVVSKI